MKLDRSDSVSARTIIEALLPNEAVRRNYIKVLAESIQLAHEYAPSKWGITLASGMVRLNVGNIEVHTLNKGRLHFVLFAQHQPEALKNVKGVVWNKKAIYSSVPGSFYINCTPSDLHQIVPVILEYHHLLIEKAARTARHSMTAAAHSPGVLRYLEEELDINIRNPDYNPEQIYISALRFHRMFQLFNKQLVMKSGNQFRSFREGLPSSMEGYKELIRNEAIRRLKVDHWKTTHVGTGFILKKVIEAIEVNLQSPKAHNNLVDWDNRRGEERRSHKLLLKAQGDKAKQLELEKWFFDFFTERSKDADAYEQFREMAGNNYDLIAYAYFLKDWSKYMPIAPLKFDKAFQMLGIDLVTNRKSSWENYTRYNQALIAVQQALIDIEGVHGARLVDAHSFCWMLVSLKSVKPEKEIVVVPIEVKEVRPIEKPMLGNGKPRIVSEDEFIERDEAKRRLGKLAQDHAFKAEVRRLEDAGHPNAKDVVKPVWDQISLGYDIQSCEVDERPRYIEVKASRRTKEMTTFFISDNEYQKCVTMANYYLYLVYDADTSHPSIQMVPGEYLTQQCLTPVTYQVRATFSE